MIRFQQGVDELSAYKIAQGQYQRFAEPGITGTITLTTDPRLSNGELMPRLMIRGGQTIRINGLFGVREGVLAHVTQATADFNGADHHADLRHQVPRPADRGRRCRPGPGTR